MDDRTKELIAIGTSIGAHCQPCLAYHVAKAKEMGIAEREILEAMSVGHMVEKGSMAAMKQFAAGVFEAPAGETPRCCTSGKSKGKSCSV